MFDDASSTVSAFDAVDAVDAVEAGRHAHAAPERMRDAA